MPNTYLLQITTSCKISENKMKSLRHLIYLFHCAWVALSRIQEIFLYSLWHFIKISIWELIKEIICQSFFLWSSLLFIFFFYLWLSYSVFILIISWLQIKLWNWKIYWETVLIKWTRIKKTLKLIMWTFHHLIYTWLILPTAFVKDFQILIYHHHKKIVFWNLNHHLTLVYDNLLTIYKNQLIVFPTLVFPNNETEFRPKNYILITYIFEF